MTKKKRMQVVGVPPSAALDEAVLRPELRTVEAGQLAVAEAAGVEVVEIELPVGQPGAGAYRDRSAAVMLSGRDCVTAAGLLEGAVLAASRLPGGSVAHSLADVLGLVCEQVCSALEEDGERLSARVRLAYVRGCHAKARQYWSKALTERERWAMKYLVVGCVRDGVALDGLASAVRDNTGVMRLVVRRVAEAAGTE